MDEVATVRDSVLKAILLRRTYRDFLPRPVEKEKVREILESARWAPSWANRQPWRIVLVEDMEIKEALRDLEKESKAVSSHWVPMFRSSGIRYHIQDFPGCPVVAAVFAHPEGAEPNQHGKDVHVLGAAAALQNMHLTVSALGLGGVLVTNFIEEKLKALLGVPWQWPLLGVLCAGYVDPDRNTGRTYEVSLRRMPLFRLAFAEQYGQDGGFGEGMPHLTEEFGRQLLHSPPLDAQPWAAELRATIRERRSVRMFATQEVSDELIREILVAGQWAPSAGNQQPWRFIVARDPETRAYIRKVHEEAIALFRHWEPVYQPDSPWGQPHDFAGTPVCIALISDPTKGGPHVDSRFSSTVACGSALQNMQLRAHALGLRTRFVSTFIPEKVKMSLDVPRTLQLLGTLAVGFSAGAPPVPKRLPLSQVAFLDQASQTLEWGIANAWRNYEANVLGPRIQASYKGTG